MRNLEIKSNALVIRASGYKKWVSLILMTCTYVPQKQISRIGVRTHADICPLEFMSNALHTQRD